MEHKAYKYSFLDDYSEGAHPRVLEALSRNNETQELGYGNDSFTQEAVRILKDKIQNEDAEIHFVTGGTQANLITLSANLQSYDSIIAPSSGHIAIREAGAIEATGHKIHAAQTEAGKIAPESIQAIVEGHADIHSVRPRSVFISQATEIGTIYKKDELQALSDVCRANNLYLYVDGARLGSALVCEEADVTLAELSCMVDMFYIGGTKNGALLGEAIVINNPALKENFKRHLKQRGALLAKGRVLGIQFLELFRDDLYFDLSRHANAMAKKIKEGIVAKGHTLLCDSCTNQIFPILPKELIEKMQSNYNFYIWSEVDAQRSAIRLVTSWATQESAVNSFLDDLA